MQRRSLVLFVLLTLFAAGCGGGQEAADESSPSPSAQAQTFTVNVDGKSDKFNLATLAYFPNELSVHPGDTVEFKEVFTGEPHTVTFGKLIDAGLAAVDKMGPPGGESPAAGATDPGTQGSPTAPASPATGATQSGTQAASPPPGGEGGQQGGPPPEMQKIPNLFGPPPTFVPLNQSAAQACFLKEGEPPVSPKGGAEACPKVDQPEFTGKETFYNSGYLDEDETFKVEFAKNAEPGTYSFMCLIHLEMMRGTVKVVEAGSEIATPEEVEEKGKQQLEKKEQALLKVREDIQKATADKAHAGAGSKDVMDAIVAEFGPKEVSIPTGGTVTWNVFSFHTISLNGPEEAVGDLIEESDGSVRPNEKAVTPSKAPKPPPVVFGPGAKPSTTQASWDGEGYFNSGQLAGFPDAEVTYKIRFTKAGTYQLQCNFHPDMEGTVKVG